MPSVDTTAPAEHKTSGEKPAVVAGTKPSDERWDLSPASGRQSEITHRPDWLDQLPHKEGDTYFIAVEAGDYPENVREEMLNDKMVAATNHYINDTLFHQTDVADVVGITPEYLDANHCIRQRLLDKGWTLTAVQLAFDNQFREIWTIAIGISFRKAICNSSPDTPARQD